MTDDREEMPKLKVMSSSDAAKAKAERQNEREGDTGKEYDDYSPLENGGQVSEPDAGGENYSVNEQNDTPSQSSGGFGLFQPSEDRKPIAPSNYESAPEPEESKPLEPSAYSEPEESVASAYQEPVAVSEPASDSDDAAQPVSKEKPKKEKKARSSSGGSALRGMISFFTILKTDAKEEDIDAMEKEFHLAPVVGGLFALVLMIELMLFFILSFNINIPAEFLAAAVVLSTVFVGSKFLHFDGLVDFGDGIVATGDKEKCTAAMKDSKVGAGGVGLAIVVTALTLGLYSSYTFANRDWLFALMFIIPATEILVKNAMVSTAAFGEPGNGMAAGQVRNTDNTTRLRSSVISAVLVLIAMAIVIAAVWVTGRYLFLPDGYIVEFGVSAFIGAIFGLIVSVVMGKLISHLAMKKFGAVTGDVLGAANEISRPIIAFTMLLFTVIFLTVLGTL